MRSSVLAFVLSASAFAFSATAHADFAIGLKGGTLGTGAEATIGLSDRFNLRLMTSSYSDEVRQDISDIRYDADIDLSTGGVMLDWHPFAGTFRLSVGYLSNGTRLKLSATPTSNQEIGGSTYTPAQIGSLTGKIKFKNGGAPYVGFGWGNAVGKGFPFGFNLEIGVMALGDAKVSLRGEGGTLSGDPIFEDDLAREVRETEDDLNEYGLYPVISLGFSYRF